jgi:dihydrofolate reductase
MRKLIVTEFVSLDGVMEAPGGEPGYQHAGWVMPHQAEEQMKYKLDEVMEAGALLIGRVTYESFAGAWPERDGPFADKMNGMPKYVVSSTLKDPEWNNTTVLEGDLADEVTKLKDSDDGPILVAGSRTLVHALYDQGLVDEYRLMVFPVVLGSGRRLFPDDAADKTLLELTDTQSFSSGVTAQTYQPAG